MTRSAAGPTPPVGRSDQRLPAAPLDLGLLETTRLVQELGSFRGAAATLGVRPSVVSRRVSALEDALGVSLFQRHSRGARLTRAGERILPLGRRILEDSLSLLKVARQAGVAAEGVLCVGVVASIAGGQARRLIGALLDAYPGVELQMEEGSQRDHIAAVRALRMDAAFMVGAPSPSGCEAEPLWVEQIMVALPASHVLALSPIISLAALSEQRFVVSKVDPGPDVHDYVIQRLGRPGLHPIVDVCAVQREGLMALVGLSRGISLVCAAEAEVRYPDVVFRPLQGETIPFNLVWSAANDNPVLRRFGPPRLQPG